ncbi:hypothetical protein EF904_03370, partial [Streptomyces sp. WAC05950]
MPGGDPVRAAHGRRELTALRTCPACGASTAPTDDFCTNCGAYLSWSSPTRRDGGPQEDATRQAPTPQAEAPRADTPGAGTPRQG